MALFLLSCYYKRMKKIVSVVAFLLLATVLFATSNPWAIKSVNLGIGNDKYAYGLSRNDDDQLSYSEHIALEATNWYLRVNLNGITNRGWKTGWDIHDESVTDDNEDHFYDGRIDVTEVKFGLNYANELKDLISMKISPETGFFLSGNTGYDFFQNTIHKIWKIKKVELKYDYEDIRFHYYLGLNANLYLDLAQLPSSKLALNLGGVASYAFGFESTEKLTATLSVNNGYSEILALSLGWNWTQEHNDSPTMELYARYINGPYLSYTINTGFFRMNYFTELTNHFGYAVLSFDVMSIFHPTIWEENNFYLSMGFAKMIGIQFQEQELNYPINDNWSIVLKNRYVAGYPTDKNEELNGDPNVEYRLKMGHVMDTLGFEFSYPLEFLKNWVAPYVSVSLGYMRWDFTALTNMVKWYEFPSLNIPYSNDENAPKYDHSFVVDLEAGLTIIPEGLVSFNSTSFTVSGFVGLSYVTGDFVKFYRQVTEDKEHAWDDYTPNWKDNFILRYGITLNFGFDI